MEPTRPRSALVTVLALVIAVLAVAAILWSPGGSRGGADTEGVRTHRTDEVELQLAAVTGVQQAELVGRTAAREGDSDAESGSLRVMVVSDEDGAPIQGARVFIDAGLWADVPSEVASVTTPEGRTELQLPDDVAQGEIKVMADGYAIWRGTLPLRRDEQVIRLMTGAEIRGRVLDTRGRAVEGASVWCARPAVRLGWPHGEAVLPGGEADGARTRSDHDGSFVLRGLSGDVAYEIYAAKDGFQRIGDFFPTLRRPADGYCEILLRPVTQLTLTVKSDDGEDLAGRGAILFDTPAGWTLLSEATFQAAIARRWSHLSTRSYSYLLAPAASEVHEEGRASVLVEIEGFEFQELDIPLRAGVRRRVVCTLHRENPQQERFPVCFRARFPDGAPLTGRFDAGLNEQKGALQRYVLEFGTDGETQTILLPAGTYEVHFGTGLDPGNDGFAVHAEALRFTVQPTHHPIHVDVPIVGNPVVLDVRSPDHRTVRGFDLRVTSTPGGPHSGFWHYCWDAPAASDVAATASGRPSLLVGRGATVVHISVPGVGGAKAEIRADGEGGVLRALVELDRSKEVLFRAYSSTLPERQR